MIRQPQDDDTVIMSPIVAHVMEASIQQTQAVTNALINNLQYQEAELRATLELVRERIGEIANRPYIVNPRLYAEALYPPRVAIDERMHLNGYKKG